MLFSSTPWRVGAFRALALSASVVLFGACQSEMKDGGLAPGAAQTDSAVAGDAATSSVQWQALQVSPQTVTVAPGKTVAFKALTWKNGVSSTAAFPVRWSATGGTITSSGVFTAGSKTGTFRVTAQGTTTSYEDEAVVTIAGSSGSTPSVSRINLTPASVTLAPNATQQFAATATMSDGSTQSSPSVTYSATGGTITTSGRYTAGGTAGTYRVIASGSGKADTSSVTISSGTTPPPSGGNGSALFSSDWRSGDLLDGGKWRRWGGQGILNIVSSSGLGFPSGMTNVMRVAMGTGSFDWVEANGKWSLPAVGQSRAFRMYLRNNVANISGGWSSTHPVESKGTDGSIAGNFWAWHLGSNTNGTFPIALAVSAPYPRNYWTMANGTGSTLGTLNKQTTYRIEWKFTRTGGNQYSLDMRVYGADDRTLVADRNSIEAWGGSSLASNPNGITVDDAFMTGIRIGLNGGFSASGTNYVYYGGFAVCSDWCGAY